MTASTKLVFTLTGVFIHWLLFNILPSGDLVLSHPLKPLLMSSLFVDVSFILLRFHLSIICHTLWFNSKFHFFIFFFFFFGMATMKGNKGKEVVGKANRPETQS